MKVLVSGLINIENSVNVHSFPVQYSPIEYAFNQVETNVSGVAYNVISALNTLGDDVTPLSIVGKDLTGRLVLDTLLKQKLKVNHVYENLEKTCTSVVLYDDGGTRKIYCDLKNLQDLVVPYKTIEKEVRDYDALVICNVNFNDEIIKSAKDSGKLIFTDVHVLSDIDDAFNARFLKNADVVFLSDQGIFGNHEEFMLSIYNKYHNKIIVLGKGSEGAMILDSSTHKVIHMPAVKTRPIVNTVGAGDALFSSFVHYYMLKKDALEALKYAQVFASYKIGESGGSKGFLSDIDLKDLVSRTPFETFVIREF